MDLISFQMFLKHGLGFSFLLFEVVTLEEANASLQAMGGGGCHH